MAEETTQNDETDAFESETPDYVVPLDDSLVLDLDGFSGPIDVLLALARDHKVDITRISILALADQYLAFIARARELRLEIAADYLVMAAWLAYLKSRLLLPHTDNQDEPSGAELAARLAFQLQRLEAMRKASEQLMQLPQLGQEFFARGAPDPVIVETTTEFTAKLYDLLSVYGLIRQRSESSVLHIAPLNLYSMDDALTRLSTLIGNIPDWTVLSNFLPEGGGDALVIRSGIASTFAASLELTKQGKLQLSQSETFAPIFLRGRKDDPDNG
ncbi:MAG: ScpA family protein [Proteobacteria bacterium]|nr:ScpA family protein [Pseudomonadota bacterium]